VFSLACHLACEVARVLFSSAIFISAIKLIYRFNDKWRIKWHQSAEGPAILFAKPSHKK
jgi:hypothetical protein